tara:strand:+ start:159 stop:338 length:180 start_codon:yes stop_codon:yes gene_type:complete
MSGLQIIFLILGLAFFIYTVTIIMSFLGISFASYGFYLLWFAAVAILFFVLPKQKKHFS